MVLGMLDSSRNGNGSLNTSCKGRRMDDNLAFLRGRWPVWGASGIFLGGGPATSSSTVEVVQLIVDSHAEGLTLHPTAVGQRWVVGFVGSQNPIAVCLIESSTMSAKRISCGQGQRMATETCRAMIMTAGCLVMAFQEGYGSCVLAGEGEGEREVAEPTA